MTETKAPQSLGFRVERFVKGEPDGEKVSHVESQMTSIQTYASCKYLTCEAFPIKPGFCDYTIEKL
jgi:hypothetical protein